MKGNSETSEIEKEVSFDFEDDFDHNKLSSVIENRSIDSELEGITHFLQFHFPFSVEIIFPFSF